MLDLELDCLPEWELFLETPAKPTTVCMDAVCPYCDSRGLEGRPDHSPEGTEMETVCRHCGHVCSW